ncbi:peptidylprolyl isomerase [Radiobacillus sp. PE A8.2]|uniref:peptidylprolyl isomerase n=1 Tax=Radiobacillus sp. PE A8.2 TaxID=3380349 RepID=UPI00388D278B
MKALHILLVLSFILLIGAAGCGIGTESESDTDQNQQAAEPKEKAEYPTVEENPIVTITMENGSQIKIELYPDVAPNTVANFISLVEKEYYNGVIFHRVIPGFMIQGGDPQGTGGGGPGYTIPGEFSSNGFTNELIHERGVISMARSQDPNSAGSQFFIMVADSPHLDGDYAAFGKVIEGIDVVDEIVASERNNADKPKDDQVMQTVEVDTKGVDYPEPEKVE